jgi:hypothetical protein
VLAPRSQWWCSTPDNPFASSGTKGIGGEKGLAPHEPPSGVFALYAASRGEAALDRLYDGDRNPNSVFTRVLVPAIASISAGEDAIELDFEDRPCVRSGSARLDLCGAVGIVARRVRGIDP